MSTATARSETRRRAGGARARVRRLADAGLVGLHRGHAGEPYAVVLTAKGAAALGVPRRERQPRTDYQRAHELAVVQLVMQLELATAAGTSVLTERDCRQLVAPGGLGYSVDVFDDRGRPHDRWPDVVVETPTGGLAFEIELSPKIGPPLASILRVYIVSSPWVASPIADRRGRCDLACPAREVPPSRPHRLGESTRTPRADAR